MPSMTHFEGLTQGRVPCMIHRLIGSIAVRRDAPKGPLPGTLQGSHEGYLRSAGLCGQNKVDSRGCRASGRTRK